VCRLNRWLARLALPEETAAAKNNGSRKLFLRLLLGRSGGGANE
jgi:hypothetical protein